MSQQTKSALLQVDIMWDYVHLQVGRSMKWSYLIGQNLQPLYKSEVTMGTDSICHCGAHIKKKCTDMQHNKYARQGTFSKGIESEI